MNDPPREITVRLFVPGSPVTQGSKNAYVNPKTHRAVMYESAHAELKIWRNLIATMAQDVKQTKVGYDWPLDKYAVKLTLDFLRHRPKSTAKYVVQDITGKDLDKLTRAVFDALTGIIYADDKQVCELHASRRFSEVMAGVMITADLRLNKDTELSRHGPRHRTLTKAEPTTDVRVGGEW